MSLSCLGDHDFCVQTYDLKKILFLAGFSKAHSIICMVMEFFLSQTQTKRNLKKSGTENVQRPLTFLKCKDTINVFFLLFKRKYLCFAI